MTAPTCAPLSPLWASGRSQQLEGSASAQKQLRAIALLQTTGNSLYTHKDEPNWGGKKGTRHQIAWWQRLAATSSSSSPRPRPIAAPHVDQGGPPRRSKKATTYPRGGGPRHTAACTADSMTLLRKSRNQQSTSPSRRCREAHLCNTALLDALNLAQVLASPWVEPLQQSFQEVFPGWRGSPWARARQCQQSLGTVVAAGRAEEVLPDLAHGVGWVGAINNRLRRCSVHQVSSLTTSIFLPRACRRRSPFWALVSSFGSAPTR